MSPMPRTSTLTPCGSTRHIVQQRSRRPRVCGGRSLSAHVLMFPRLMSRRFCRRPGGSGPKAAHPVVTGHLRAPCTSSESLIGLQARGLRFSLRKLLGTRVRNSRVRGLSPSRTGPSAGFDKLPLFPRLDLLELCELHHCVGLLHESRDAGGSKSDDHGRIRSVYCHPFGTAAEGPTQPGKADDRGSGGAEDHTPGSWFKPRYLKFHETPPQY